MSYFIGRGLKCLIYQEQSQCMMYFFRAHYTRRKFRLIYAKVMKKSPHVHRNSASFIRYYGNANLTLSLLAETLPASKEMPLFDYPFNELMVGKNCSLLYRLDVCLVVFRVSSVQNIKKILYKLNLENSHLSLASVINCLTFQIKIINIWWNINSY